MNRLKLGLDQRPEHLDLADIVNQSEPRTYALYIHFVFGALGEAVHLLMHTDVGKDWLDHAHLLQEVELEPPLRK